MLVVSDSGFKQLNTFLSLGICLYPIDLHGLYLHRYHIYLLARKCRNITSFICYCLFWDFPKFQQAEDAFSIYFVLHNKYSKNCIYYLLGMPLSYCLHEFIVARTNEYKAKQN